MWVIFWCSIRRLLTAVYCEFGVCAQLSTLATKASLDTPRGPVDIYAWQATAVSFLAFWAD